MILRLRALGLVVAVGLLAGCASGAERRLDAERPAEAPAPAGGEKAASLALKAGTPVQRMLVRRAYLQLESDDLKEVAARAGKIVKDAGGFVQSSSFSEEHSLHLDLRVPEPKLDLVLDALSKLGDVERRSVSVEDVTEEAADLDARLKNLVSVRDRLRKLLDAGTKVEEIVLVERELARIQGELDAYEARLKVLRSSSALSTVSLTAERGRILGPLGWLGYGLWWGFSKLFVIR
jgi:hypothetical protein